MIDGATLIAWGFKPGRQFKHFIAAANQLRAEGLSDERIAADLRGRLPVAEVLRAEGLPYAMFLDAPTAVEQRNAAAVREHMDALMRVPTITAGAVMPDACPAGREPGTIPVGGVVACRDAIHPGFHSADICCSVAMSVLERRRDPKALLDAVQAVTHFGPGRRESPPDLEPIRALLAGFSDNPFTRGLEGVAAGQFATQGDGNHFASVGRLASSGDLVLVTHHGSRGFGAQLYKRGMAAAARHAATHAPRVPAHNAWLKASSTEGEAYWAALQTVRAWTKASHFAIHDEAARRTGNPVAQRLWNEHNFVFRKADGLFYHGKGATPSWPGFAADDSGLTLIPLNMSEPILVTEHRDKPEALGFAPHGAGRNASRTRHLQDAPEGALAAELAELGRRGLDIRSFCGVPDLSELPSAYKDAEAVTAQIEAHGLARIVDRVLPYGLIMAGYWMVDAPWRKKAVPVAVSEAV